MTNKGHWFNYKTNEHEFIVMPLDFTYYIPQLDATQEMYKAYLEQGVEPIEALRKVLHAWAGIEPALKAIITTESLKRALMRLEGKEPLPEREER